MKEDATIIDWRTFRSPSENRPFGLMITDDATIPKNARKRMFEIAAEMIGPAPWLDSDNTQHGNWIATHDARAWGFSTEGARSLFAIATKGNVADLRC